MRLSRGTAPLCLHLCGNAGDAERCGKPCSRCRWPARSRRRRGTRPANGSGVARPFIEFENVTVMRDDVVALDRLDLRIDEGERVAVLGPNGAGKSTFVQALT